MLISLAMGCLNEILLLGVSARTFPNEITFESVDSLSRWPSPVWVSIIQPVEGLTGIKGRGRRNLRVLLAACLLDLGHLILSSLVLRL